VPEDTHARIAEVFRNRFGHACAAVASAPGRVNLLGEHVDYNDGFVLPVAIDRRTYVAFRASDMPANDLWAGDFGQAARFSAASLREKREPDGNELPVWARYPAGVAWSLNEAGLPPKAMQAAFASEVPRGAGLSSSASVEIAFGLAWMYLADTPLARMELSRLCQRAENEYVGVNCGIMDQAASACSQPDCVMVLDCRTLEFQLLPVPESVVIVVADTGVRHALADSEYNERRRSCEQAVRLLQRRLPGITALRDVLPAELNRFAADLPSEIELRARHVVDEIDRTRQAAGMLRAGDVQAFGALMNACHASLRDLYQVSCPELDTMVGIAQASPGCFGARLTGAGFGGCTVNLVDREQADVFVRSLADGYEAATRRLPQIYTCTASGGATVTE